MEQNVTWNRKQRTLVIGAGHTGQAVVQALQRRLMERGQDVPNMACLAVVGNGESPAVEPLLANQQSQIVTLETCSPATPRPEAQSTLAAAETTITSALVEALSQVSRIDTHLSHFRGSFPNWSEDVAVYVVAALDEPVGSAIFLDLASLARRLIGQRFNVAAEVGGLLFLPNPLLSDDPGPVLARTYAVLRELDAGMRSRNGHLTPGRDKLFTQEEDPAFDGGCYLLGAFNTEGLSLESPKERIELAAEALLQLALTPLGSGLKVPLMAWQGMEGRPHSYRTLGLSAWVYPRRALAQVLARRLAVELFSAWLTHDETPSLFWTDVSVEAESYVTGCMAEVKEGLLPPETPGEVELGRPLAAQLSWDRLGRFLQDLEDEAAARLEPLVARRPELDQRAEALGEEMAGNLAQAWTRRLDVAASGRLTEAMTFLAGAEQHLACLQEELKESADAYWKDLESLDIQLERTKEEVEGLISRFPKPSVEAVLPLLRHPRQVFSMFLTYKKVIEAGARYGALLTRQMAVAMEVLRCDLLVQVCERGQRDVQAQQVQLAVLGEILQAAQQELQAGHEPQPDVLFAQFGTSFGLERSVLTPETVDTLYDLVRGDLADRLSDVAQIRGPLSTWLRTQPDEQTIVEICLEHAHHRCQVLAQVTVDELLFEILSNVPLRSEALRGLVALASPFLGWDETRLRGVEHQGLRIRTMLGIRAGMASPLLEDVGDIPGAEVIATGDDQRVTVLSIVHGLPLAALAGLEEYASAYHDADAASLHTTPEWRDLPDLLESTSGDNGSASYELPSDLEGLL